MLATLGCAARPTNVSATPHQHRHYHPRSRRRPCHLRHPPCLPFRLATLQRRGPTTRLAVADAPPQSLHGPSARQRQLRWGCPPPLPPECILQTNQHTAISHSNASTGMKPSPRQRAPSHIPPACASWPLRCRLHRLSRRQYRLARKRCSTLPTSTRALDGHMEIPQVLATSSTPLPGPQAVLPDT